MKTYPLQNLTVEEAIEKQFNLVNKITHHFKGFDFLNLGDLGVHFKENMPLQTRKVEKVIASFFNQEEAILTRGSGTGALREAFYSVMKPGDTILVHKAKIYNTTEKTLKMLGIKVEKVNYNDISSVINAVKNEDLDAILIQHTRQSFFDSYHLETLISAIKKETTIPIIIDDNYAVMKVEKIGVEMDADLSCFSSYKLMGPEGVGVIVGKKTHIEKIRELHYSGGSQVQGFEAMEVLRGLVYSPVLLAIQAIQVDEIVRIINNLAHPLIEQAFVANSQSRVVILKFKKPIARKVLEEAERLGALPYPVGSESKYEIPPLFYRISKTMLDEIDKGSDYYIRINPMKSSSNTVMEILLKSMKEVSDVS